MTHGRVSRVVARLLRPFHRHAPHFIDVDVVSKRQRGSLISTTTSTCSTSPSSSRGSDSVRNVFTLKTNSNGIPYAVLMPSALLRHLRALVEQTNALTTSDHRASHKLPGASSRTSIRWRGDFSTRTLNKIVQVLTEDDTDGFARTIKRRLVKLVSLETAAKTMLQLWDCCLRILCVLAEGAAPEPLLRHTMAHWKDVATVAATEKKYQLAQAAVALLVVMIRRQEFDALLVAVGHGGCKSHKPMEEARHAMSRLSRRLSRHSRRSMVRGTRVSLSMNSSSHQKPHKRKPGRTGRLCDSVHHLLELHQSTLQYAFDAVHGPIDASRKSTTELHPLDLHQELLAALVSTSFLRIPCLRGQILDSLSHLVPSTSYSHTRSRSLSIIPSRGRTRVMDEDVLRRTPYHWHLSMYPQCQNLLTTVNREDRWASSTQIIRYLMADFDNCTVVLGRILEHLTGQQVLGFTNWKCIPGAELLKDATLKIVKTMYQMELLHREPMWQDSNEDQSNELALASDTILVPESVSRFDRESEELSPPIAQFALHVNGMMHENVSFIHDYLMTILRATNYMLPHHINLCLEYLEHLVHEFPFYFVNDPVSQNFLDTQIADSPPSQPLQEHACADIETLLFVFTCLLDSEHFEILKATELFLLRNFTKFSVLLQVQLTELFARHVKRLFLHWNRDVRYCYYHILLYLSYPGNRMVLGAKSDEAIMGAKASRLFEIPGLVRTGNTVSWDAYDIPLRQIVARYTQVTKRRPVGAQTATWVDAVPWHVVQRSVTEYTIHVKSYFDYAQQVSMHQRVPTPEFAVKTEENVSSATLATATLA